MQVTIEIPGALAAQLAVAGTKLDRAVLEALLVDAYRRRLLNEGQIKAYLGYGTRMQVHQLLKQHNVHLHYTEEHLRQDLVASEQATASAA
jgi:hypothetical protein